jgi:hypothetical protein
MTTAHDVAGIDGFNDPTRPGTGQPNRFGEANAGRSLWWGWSGCLTSAAHPLCGVVRQYG